MDMDCHVGVIDDSMYKEQTFGGRGWYNWRVVSILIQLEGIPPPLRNKGIHALPHVSNEKRFLPEDIRINILCPKHRESTISGVMCLTSSWHFGQAPEVCDADSSVRHH